MEEVRVGVGHAEVLVGGVGVLGIGNGEGKAVAKPYGIVLHQGSRSAVDKVLNSLHRA